jgi:hypothetical protein
MSPIVRFGKLLGGVIAVLGAPIAGFFLTRIFLEARASSSWPHADGIVERAEVKDINLGIKHRYRADVLYSYRVEGVAYHGSRIRASDGEVDQREGIESDLTGLKVGAPVAVYYNPVKRSESVLQPGVRTQEWIVLFIPVIMFALGVLAIRKGLA